MRTICVTMATTRRQPKPSVLDIEPDDIRVSDSVTVVWEIE